MTKGMKRTVIGAAVGGLAALGIAATANAAPGDTTDTQTITTSNDPQSVATASCNSQNADLGGWRSVNHDGVTDVTFFCIKRS